MRARLALRSLERRKGKAVADVPIARGAAMPALAEPARSDLCLRQLKATTTSCKVVRNPRPAVMALVHLSGECLERTVGVGMVGGACLRDRGCIAGHTRGRHGGQRTAIRTGTLHVRRRRCALGAQAARGMRLVARFGNARTRRRSRTETVGGDRACRSRDARRRSHSLPAWRAGHRHGRYLVPVLSRQCGLGRVPQDARHRVFRSARHGTFAAGAVSGRARAVRGARKGAVGAFAGARARGCDLFGVPTDAARCGHGCRRLQQRRDRRGCRTPAQGAGLSGLERVRDLVRHLRRAAVPAAASAQHPLADPGFAVSAEFDRVGRAGQHDGQGLRSSGTRLPRRRRRARGVFRICQAGSIRRWRV